MFHSGRHLVAAGVLLTLAATARAEDRCLVKAVIGGKPATMKNCAVAMYDASGVTLFFSESPISAEEAATFQLNSYPKEKDANGKPRSMMHFAFCPGGPKKIPSPGAVKSVEVSVNHASSLLMGRQWVFELPKDKELKIEKLSGKLAPGGRLAGRITGAKTSDGLKYSWEADFDVQLPQKAAAAGPACGS
jgi:hypothetical protein